MVGKLDSGSKEALKTNFQNLNSILFKMRKYIVMVSYNILN